VTGRRGTPGVDVVVRPLTGADLDQLDRLERQLFDAAAWSRASFAEELEADGRWYLGAERTADGALIGYAGIWFDGYDAQVMTIAVDPAHQDHGLGRDLLTQLVAHAREVGAAQVLLEVRVDNAPAIHLYESVGFQMLGRRRAYYQPGNIDAFTMRLPLGDA
jgi:[ribosomal protein S18]-alanine N-acetyltransferase